MPDETSAAAPAKPLSTDNVWWILAGLLLLIAGIAYSGRDGLAGLMTVGGTITLILAIAGLVVLYRALSLTAASEALGLPANSVRALLAIILLGLLATLGSQFFGSLQSTTELSRFESIKPDQLTLAAGSGITPLIERTDDKGLVTGRYVKRGASPVAEDLAKNITSQLLVLLASVISFYFGTQSSKDGMKVGADILKQQAPPTGSGTDAGPSSATPGTDPGARALAIRNQVKQVADRLQALGPDPVAALRAKVDGLSDAAQKKVLDDDARSAALALDTGRTAVKAATDAANGVDKAAAAIAQAGDDAAAAKAAQTALDESASATERALADAKQALDRFEAARDRILNPTG